ncbi:MAG: hypothetical protein C0601_06895 [Candidatus Muiribacterium halophilum]|uniref:Uncharacterized protein n=1 Tax=Muiribacterium halophilum TaxID=2053465 RepID=A0A2N5ZGK6_MUIH1|nr:MAG: hypothetical protein C0601_06895 [Candidatus Muirbacterium halophilum]
MSVCIWMIPIALAVRAVIGEQKLQELAEKNEIRVSSGISEKEALGVALKKIGYDVIDFAGSLKVHLKDKDDYFFIDKIEGVWTFCFPKYLGDVFIKQFINEFDSSSGTNLKENIDTKKLEIEEIKEFPTNFKDKELLKKVIREYGMSCEEENNGDLVCNATGNSIRFIQENNDSPFFVRFESFKDASEMLSLIGVLDESYRSRIQKRTYQNFMDNLKDSEYTVVSETRQQDRSIVITLKTED